MRTFELNLFHAVRALRAPVPHMRARGGGSAVVISSISGWKPGPRTQYGAAKAGEIFLSGAWPGSWRRDRIRVNTVSPGSTLFPGGGWERTRRQDPERFAELSSSGSSPGAAWDGGGDRGRGDVRPLRARHLDQRGQHPGRRGAGPAERLLEPDDPATPANRAPSAQMAGSG